MKVILYARVSSDDQVRGYSLDQQIGALREWAAREGHEVLEEVRDEGWSGAYLERPGLDRVRDLVAAGGVSVVLAQDRDRFAREPAYLYILKEEFARHDCSLRAITSRGDESPEGELTDGILDQLAKFERAKTAERTRRGKLQKARSGKVMADGAPNYGFNFNDARDGYVVDEEKMRVVRRVFRELAGGSSINAVVGRLRSEGIPSPASHAASWSHSQIRALVGFDVYKPHSREELEALASDGLMSPDVLLRLDPERFYGVWWYNRRRHTREKSRERKRPDGGYADRHHRAQKSRDEWVAVPVPDAGVPREDVERARRRIGGRTRPSRAEGRFWELAGGGVLRCGECGGGMRARSVKRRKGRRGAYTDFYYTCNNAFQKRGCDHTTIYRAGDLEDEVMRKVDGVLSDREWVRREVDAAIAREEARVRDPGGAAEVLSQRLTAIAAKRAAFQEQQAAGLMTLPELAERLGALDEDRATVEAELGKAQDAVGRIEELKERRALVLSWYGTGLHLGLSYLPPELRRATYDLLGLRVSVGRGGAVSAQWEMDAGMVRYSREVEEYVAALEEAGARPPVGESDLTVAERFEVVREELERLRRESGESFFERREMERSLARASTDSASTRTPTARAHRAVRGDPRRRDAPSAPRA